MSKAKGGTAGNRGSATSRNDTWLTPRDIVESLGPFDLDPACPPSMPWRTATRMISLPGLVNPRLIECEVGDGLNTRWVGRVWTNPPFSKILPWVARHALHRNGIMLCPAKSPETRWGQLLLKEADLLWYYAGRFPFCYPDGSQSRGAWHPLVFAAFGDECARRLLNAGFPGVGLQKVPIQSR